MTNPQVPVDTSSPARRLAELHHQLRSVLAAGTLSLDTFQLVGKGRVEVAGRTIDRAMFSIQEALRLADEIRAVERAILEDARSRTALEVASPPAETGPPT